MDIRALHAFHIVAETGSFTAAAARLGTVQSALSARIAQFEAMIGEPLFERLPRGIRLTAAGHRLLPYASRMEMLTTEAISAARGHQSAFTGPLRLGAIEVIAASTLPPVLGQFLSDKPDLDIRFRTGVSQDLVTSLIAGELDAAIVAHDDKRQDFASTLLARVPLALIYPLGSSPEAFRQAFSFKPGCACRSRLEALIHQRRFGMRVVELGSVEAILGCVEAGIGITLMPEQMARGRAVDFIAAGHLDIFLAYRLEADMKAQALMASYAQIHTRSSEAHKAT